MARIVFACLAALFTASLSFSQRAAHADGDQVPATMSVGTPMVADGQPTPAGQLFGINDHPLDGTGPADAAAMLDQLKQIGGDLARIDVHWAWLEWARPGRANWNPDQVRLLDTYLNAASNRGIAVQLTVSGTPCWAASGPPRNCLDGREREAAQNTAPRNEREFAAFVQELVRFSAGRVKFIGVGNEPNHPAFWAQPDPAAYTRLLLASYPAIKSEDPNVAVVGGALAPGNPQGATLDTIAYLHGMYAAGARGAFDYLEYHPYTDAHAPDWFDSSWPLLSFQRSVPLVRAEMLANGDDRPMILGEMGWAASQGGTVKGSVSSNLQADYLANALQIAQGWPYVQSVIVYELADHGAADSTAAIDHFGLLDRSLHAKPAAMAFLNQVQAQRQNIAALPINQ